jgi:transcriptional regulator with XRE-family HTH domain
MIEICPCCNQVIRHKSPLAQLRKARGLTISQLARASGVSRPLISLLENGHATNPTLHTLTGLAEGLGCPLADVIAAFE